MATNPKRYATHAPQQRWKLLGELLQQRRRELGYTHRPAFARDRLPPTPDGNENVRLVADIENAYPSRINTFPPGTLRLLAQAYGVTYESVESVLRGSFGELAPVARLAGPEAAPGLPPAPQSELLREDAVRPYATPIWERLLELAGRGVLDPTGAQLGLAPDDAKIWDGSAGAMTLADRAWLVGDIRRRREARAAERDANSA